MRDRQMGGPPIQNRRKSEDLKDEVYRQMFRLETHRTGAERSLAIALLRAWMISDAEPRNAEERSWLRKICPICIAMMEDPMEAQQSHQTI